MLTQAALEQENCWWAPVVGSLEKDGVEIREGGSLSTRGDGASLLPHMLGTYLLFLSNINLH